MRSNQRTNHRSQVKMIDMLRWKDGTLTLLNIGLLSLVGQSLVKLLLIIIIELGEIKLLLHGDGIEDSR